MLIVVVWIIDDLGVWILLRIHLAVWIIVDLGVVIIVAGYCSFKRMDC